MIVVIAFATCKPIALQQVCMMAIRMRRSRAAFVRQKKKIPPSGS